MSTPKDRRKDCHDRERREGSRERERDQGESVRERAPVFFFSIILFLINYLRKNHFHNFNF